MAFYDTPGVLYDSGVLYDASSAPQPIRSRMAKVKLSLNGLNPDALVAFANVVKTAMTGNANFTTPLPTLPAFGTLITTASTKIAAYNSALATAETALADRDAALTALRSGFSQLGDYVQNVAAGDKVKIESAGMAVRSAGAPTTMTQVLELALSAGDSPGSVDAMWKPVPGARSYESQVNTVNPDVEANWSFKKSTSKSSDTYTGLTSGAKLWVRVRAIGTNDNAGAYSDPATKVVP
jgi:hypothetical protein